MRASSTAAVVFIATVFVVGCSQSTSPTVPSSALTAPASAQLGPGASYDASGIWHFVVSDVHGNVEETFDADIDQDAETGNLSFIDDDGNPISLERLGTGVVVTYRLSFTVDESPCDFKASGTARLDTRTETLEVNVAIQDTDCRHFVQVVTATR